MKKNDFKFSGACYIPKDENIKRIVFLLHGYGANGDDLIDLSYAISKKIPETAFYAPNAPFPLDENEFYMPAGYQWFTIDGYDPEKIKNDQEYFKNLCNKRLCDAQKILPSLWEYINDIAKSHNVSQENIVIAGFSQGGFMALLTALTKKEKLGGSISFSGVPLANNIFDIIENEIPILLTHGDSDDVVPLYSVDITEKILKKKNMHPEKHISYKISHGIDNSAIERAIKFLEKNLLQK